MSSGGAFQYEAGLLDALSDITGSVSYELVCINHANESLRGILQSGQLRYGNLPLRPLGEFRISQPPPESFLQAPHEDALPASFTLSDEIVPDPIVGEALRDEGIDLLFSLHATTAGPDSLLPFIAPIHDLQHRIQPEFPEVSAGGIAEAREATFRRICRYATLVLVDSDAGRNDVLRYYGDLIDGDRIRVLPYFPPARRVPSPGPKDIARVRSRYSLPERFFFYPAQFWKHKNHRLIVEALALLEKTKGEQLHVVFAGTYTERERARNFLETMALAENLGVLARVHYLGFVPDRDIPALYTLSAGLVMPTFFGPTNMPPLEAWSFGRPVIITGLPSIRAQLGDGALYIDPREPASLAQAMLALWHNDALAEKLVANGAQRLALYSYEDFANVVRTILDEGVDRVRRNRNPAYPVTWAQACTERGE